MEVYGNIEISNLSFLTESWKKRIIRINSHNCMFQRKKKSDLKRKSHNATKSLRSAIKLILSVKVLVKFQTEFCMDSSPEFKKKVIRNQIPKRSFRPISNRLNKNQNCAGATESNYLDFLSSLALSTINSMNRTSANSFVLAVKLKKNWFPCDCIFCLGMRLSSNLSRNPMVLILRN